MVKICLIDKCGNSVHRKDLCYEHYDEHAICKQLGKSLVHFLKDPTYVMKCTKCSVSYSTNDKDKLFRVNKCPCCHYMLRLRKGTKRKKIDNLDKGI